MLLLPWEPQKLLPNVKSKYFNIAELLQIAFVVMATELLSERRDVPNVK